MRRDTVTETDSESDQAAPTDSSLEFESFDPINIVGFVSIPPPFPVH